MNGCSVAGLDDPQIHVDLDQSSRGSWICSSCFLPLLPVRSFSVFSSVRHHHVLLLLCGLTLPSPRSGECTLYGESETTRCWLHASLSVVVSKPFLCLHHRCPLIAAFSLNFLCREILQLISKKVPLYDNSQRRIFNRTLDQNLSLQVEKTSSTFFIDSLLTVFV